MSYTPTNWQTGDIVSSQKLNKLEDGVRDAYEVMVINNTNDVLDKTWQEIYDAANRGRVCLIRNAAPTSIAFSYINEVASEASETPPLVKYYVSTIDDSVYETDTSDDYPAIGVE